MSNVTQQDAAHDDPVASMTPVVPWVLPMAGAALIFLLAFIAVFMA